MKIKFLGTAAAEGIPGLFCNCEKCEKVRKDGGKDVRSRSQSIIDDELLVDFNQDSLYHEIDNKLNFGDIRYLLVTHSHSDHWYPQEFYHRDNRAHGKFLKYEKLEIYCNAAVKKLFFDINEIYPIQEKTLSMLEFNVIKPFDTVRFGEYTVTALPANHKPDEDAFIYFIEKGGKTLFYCNDTGMISEEVFDWLKDKRIDLAELDCTMGSCPSVYGHMGYANCVELKNRLTVCGALSEKSIVVINHFSHNNYIFYDELSKTAEKDGIVVSYDGLEIEF